MTIAQRTVEAAPIPAPAAPGQQNQEDAALLTTAAQVARQFTGPKPAIYWTDLLLTITIGYGALLALLNRPFDLAAAGCFVVAVLALYRAESFIHELTHIPFRKMRSFHIGWNLLVGIPLLTPSFMYEGVHNQHHLRTSYGTPRDPEYLPLAGAGWGKVAGFTGLAALAPIGLFLRFAILAPVGLLNPQWRRAIVARFSALAINPDYRRTQPKPEVYHRWLLLEAGCTIWALCALALVLTHLVSLRSVALVFAVVMGVALINQVRTLGAHVWKNETGEAMSLTAQFADSVNVPPPALLPMLWAPVGLRYHALHHLLPSLPYHDLGKAHRLLADQFGKGKTYHGSSYPSLLSTVRSWVGSGTARTR
ncbi:fatty acid desaturase family protein [Novosphingobium terrae]|uniref:fatty acid desaturase family protein n=1 Tax=Novosphingobium terrae TaxID=2726189 RepID=UPI00197EEB53|nr:fatty acid desaturase [Novosphingobium terrae]